MSSDAANMARLHRAAFVHDRPWTEREFQDVLGWSGVAVFITKEGFMLMRCVSDEAEILTIAVHPDAQKAGLGSQLVEAGLRHAAAKGAERIFLEVAADNAAAFSLYQRHGFAESGRRKAYYKRSGGAAVDALLMQTALTIGHGAD